ncbi:hypothetical protein CCACVL1_08950 [Corchorus capsularis]|uniref:Uncharacterized protein n=1 Tax=Corchorus capsularis TaxID=210143 RepID=A0A1R3IY91_COCAP|nr:hypothetical protein CCACVL1_08950 [Corchorus capsularis]
MACLTGLPGPPAGAPSTPSLLQPTTLRTTT